MINTDNVIHASGLVLVVLVAAIVIGCTSIFIFGTEKEKQQKGANQIYDEDRGRNLSHICIASEEPYATAYEKSPCFNKTLLRWYNPWLRHHLWKKFWTEIETRRKNRTSEATEPEVTESPVPNETVLEEAPPQEETSRERPEGKERGKERPIEFVYVILVGMMTISTVVACWEVFKDRRTMKQAAAAKVQERQCTLADFTINRHLRRESQQQAASHLQRQASLELTAKVTQNLIHQSSLDRAFPKIVSGAMNAGKPRRNSMPYYLAGETESPSKRSLPGPASGLARKRFSVDASGEEKGLDLKKKSRFFIRRH